MVGIVPPLWFIRAYLKVGPYISYRYFYGVY